jgi:hypothetical protein
VTISNVFPWAIVPPDFVTETDEYVDINFEGLEINDMALMERTESFWYRYIWDDGTQTDWINKGTIAPPALKILLLNSWTPSEGPQIMSGIEALLQARGFTIYTLDEHNYYSAAAPTLAYMLDYDVILTSTNYFIYDTLKMTQLGDRLADYTDAGGSVVQMTFAGGLASSGFTGRWQAEDYTPIPYSGNVFGYLNLGDVYDPAHPIMDGVSELSAYYKHATSGVTSGATRLADYQGGNTLCAYTDKDHHSPGGGRIVGLNFFPWPTYVTGDAMDMMLNAILWAWGEDIPTPVLATETHGYGDNGIYNINLQIIDDDMWWDDSSGDLVFVGPNRDAADPGADPNDWITDNIITIEILDTEPTVSPIRARAEVDIILEVKHGDKDSSSADVKLFKNGIEIAQETSYGKEKCGGIEEMTLMYTGGGTVTAYKADVTDLGGGLYLITPTGSYTKLKAHTQIYVNGVEVANIHTSCSKPINIGDIHGDFTIVDLVKIMKTGPPAIIPAIIEIGQGDMYEITVKWNQGTKNHEDAYLWLRYADGKTKKLRQKLTPTNPTWTISNRPFMEKLLDTPIIFTASATDPGSDDFAFVWNFNDETKNQVHLYDNDDQTTAVDGHSAELSVIFDQLPGRDPWFDRTDNTQRSPDMNPMNVDDTTLHSFKGKHKYSKCKGVSEMVLEYAGGAGAAVTANDAMVSDNADGTYTFTPTGDKLKASTKVSVDGSEEADIHTSCSKPIEIGMVYGDFTIVGLNKIGAGDANYYYVSLIVADDDFGDGYPSYQNFLNDGGYDMEFMGVDLTA